MTNDQLGSGKIVIEADLSGFREAISKIPSMTPDDHYWYRELRVERHLEKRGYSDEWQATIGDVNDMLPGIGRSRTEAVGNLVGANLERFGIWSRVDIDPDATDREVVWKSPQLKD